ncbi:hypothetical protein FACS189449_00330 [Alphaproteobacteria bacterium]|nr:hypothetical protein FACS189449_00330 [Alphaproteobacteria bacterium]
MSKNMLIDSAHMEEIRLAVVDGEKLDKFDFETPSKVQIKGNIYLAKIIRVEPSLQAAFVDYGGDKHGFLGFSEIHHDYFQIPVGDREELEARIQSAMAARAEEAGETEEDMDQREISRLRYQFYRRYKIQEVIKKRQIMLVQVTKEERGNKGATLTTYISLAGRYCILMPNMSKGSGVSRKVSNPVDREKLKSIVSGLHTENGSTVVRTAGIGRSKTEIRKDFDYLKKLWDEIREITLKSTAPCMIYEEANIIKRAIRDFYSRDIESVIIEGEEGYKIAKNYVKKLMPSHSKKIIQYKDPKVPIFSKYKINDQVDQIYSTRVDLPSGGYLIINTTEALISIDVNSGKSTRERNVAGTALKTNLEAAVEVARQCRLRDLAGLIVVDFIDMEEKRNNSQVERLLRESLREDKAKIQVGVISNFGLLEFSRQRMRSSIVEANMITCPHCSGSGVIWSDESIALQILRKIEEACSAMDLSEVNVTLSTDVALYLLNNKRAFIASIENRGLKINFNIDSSIATTDFKIAQVIKSPNSGAAEKTNSAPSAEKSSISSEDKHRIYTGGTIHTPAEPKEEEISPEIPEPEITPVESSDVTADATAGVTADATLDATADEAANTSTVININVAKKGRNGYKGKRPNKFEKNVDVDAKDTPGGTSEQKNSDTSKKVFSLNVKKKNDSNVQKENEQIVESKPESAAEVKAEESKPESTAEVKTEESKPESTAEVKTEESKPESTAEVKTEESKPESTAEVKAEESKKSRSIQRRNKFRSKSKRPSTEKEVGSSENTNADASGQTAIPADKIISSVMPSIPLIKGSIEESPVMIISEKQKALAQFVGSYFYKEPGLETEKMKEALSESAKKNSKNGWWKKLIKKPTDDNII